MYDVKGIKSFEGMEGLGFNATLYRDGRKVAEVRDMGNGGQMDFDWIDPEEEWMLLNYLSGSPPVVVPNCPRPLKMTPDLYLAQLVDEVEAKVRNARRNRVERNP